MPHYQLRLKMLRNLRQSAEDNHKKIKNPDSSYGESGFYFVEIIFSI